MKPVRLLLKDILSHHLRYGATLVRDQEIGGGDLLIVIFCVMIGASQIGNAQPSFEAISNARGAAHFVFEIIERVCDFALNL